MTRRFPLLDLTHELSKKAAVDTDEKIMAKDKAITDTKKRLGRDCGACSLCCYILEIDELKKPTESWCQHCRPGNGGCSIYNERPPVCRGFACQWLIDSSFAEHWFPKRARMVALFREIDGIGSVLEIHVDSRLPNRWREEPYLTDIRKFARAGLMQELDFPFQTQVFVGDKLSWLIFLDREIDLSTDQYGAIVQIGSDEFTWMKTKSKAHSEAIINAMNEIAEKVKRPAFGLALARIIQAEHNDTDNPWLQRTLHKAIVELELKTRGTS